MGYFKLKCDGGDCHGLLAVYRICFASSLFVKKKKKNSGERLALGSRMGSRKGGREGGRVIC